MRLFILFFAAAAAFAQTTFSNPILPNGADPWIEYQNGNYYLTVTTGRNIVIRKSPTLAGLKDASPVIVWTPPENTVYSKQVWAPELHRVRNKWYVYFAASDGDNVHHRIYVIENSDADPTTTHWNFKGKLATRDDHWAIDLTTFEYKGKWYSVWSGWQGDVDGEQDLYIARMKNPWAFASARTRISKPEHDWETHGDLGKGQEARHVNINEGPEALQHNGHLFLTYSASACWTDNYALGLLTLKRNGNPLKASDWTKSSQPVFQTDPTAQAYGTGHNGFFTSPDGRQNWIVFHANPESHQGCNGHRATRVQPFTWNADGTPNLGKPLPLDQPLTAPSGEKP